MNTKSIISIIICVCLFLGLAVSANAQTIEVEQIQLKETTNYWELTYFVEEYTSKKKECHEKAEKARRQGYAEDSKTILNAKAEWQFYKNIADYYQEKLNEVEKEFEDIEYRDATLVWEYMKYLGWNDYVCAGILGNMMAEVGGGTLDLDTTCNTSPGFYGLCQWSQSYAEGAWYKDLKEQMEFLKEDIGYQFEAFGFCYSNNFTLKEFLELENERETALAFMKCYERGTPHSNWARQQYATIALEYYTTH